MNEKQFQYQDLENLTEEIVRQELDQMFRTNTCKMCTCEICIQDVLALVLNKVPSLYITNHLEDLEAHTDFTKKKEKLRKLVRYHLAGAIETVSTFPHH